jgi:large subunit ribosomal protein L14
VLTPGPLHSYVGLSLYMIRKGSFLDVMDNSGASVVKCIHVYGVKERGYGRSGDRILVSVRERLQAKTISKGNKFSGIITQVAKAALRNGGESIRFTRNAVVLLKTADMPLGTRVLGPVMLELRMFGYVRIVSLSVFTV